MTKDLRDLVKNFDETPIELSSDHAQKFEKKLEKMYATSRNTNFFFIKIAASLLFLVGIGYMIVSTNHNKNEGFVEQEAELISLSSISPEMQKIENYYQTAIHFELASLQPNKDNTALIDSYLDKIGKLDRDYQRLNKELISKGIDTTTISKLVTNLQLRLQLLLQLKDQIQELQTVNQKEYEQIII